MAETSRLSTPRTPAARRSASSKRRPPQSTVQLRPSGSTLPSMARRCDGGRLDARMSPLAATACELTRDVPLAPPTFFSRTLNSFHPSSRVCTHFAPPAQFLDLRLAAPAHVVQYELFTAHLQGAQLTIGQLDRDPTGWEFGILRGSEFQVVRCASRSERHAGQSTSCLTCPPHRGASSIPCLLPRSHAVLWRRCRSVVTNFNTPDDRSSSFGQFFAIAPPPSPSQPPQSPPSAPPSPHPPPPSPPPSPPTPPLLPPLSPSPPSPPTGVVYELIFSSVRQTGGTVLSLGEVKFYDANGVEMPIILAVNPNGVAGNAGETAASAIDNNFDNKCEM